LTFKGSTNGRKEKGQSIQFFLQTSDQRLDIAGHRNKMERQRRPERPRKVKRCAAAEANFFENWLRSLNQSHSSDARNCTAFLLQLAVDPIDDTGEQAQEAEHHRTDEDETKERFRHAGTPRLEAGQGRAAASLSSIELPTVHAMPSDVSDETKDRSDDQTELRSMVVEQFGKALDDSDQLIHLACSIAFAAGRAK
jgi:hypothetical protein